MGYTVTDTLFDQPVRVRDRAYTPHPGASKTYMVRLPTGTLPNVSKCYTPDKVLVKLPREHYTSGKYVRCPAAKNERYAYTAAQALDWDIVPEVLDPRCVFPGTVPDGVVVTRWLNRAIAEDNADNRVRDHAVEHARACVFQVLIRHGDTHGQNMLYAAGRFWSIDHDVLDEADIPGRTAEQVGFIRDELEDKLQHPLPVKVRNTLRKLLA